jgi:riboflavin synthase
MFTGIVTDIGLVESVKDHGSALRRIRINASYEAAGIVLGASIACAGPCLTVVAVGARPEGGCWFEIDAAAETLARTNVAEWKVGTRLNLERALKIGDELGGHLVSGHVDGVAEVIARDNITDKSGSSWGATAKFTIRVPRELAKYVVEKGSVALDGTSLTINSVDRDVLTVLLIPHTLEVTTWGAVKAGTLLHIEVDQMARYAARLAEARAEGY